MELKIRYKMLQHKMLSMPLQNDINAQLFAQIDVNSLNKELKAFIQQEVENGIKTAMANLAENVVNRKLDSRAPQLEGNFQHKFVQATTELQGLLLMCIY